MTARDPWASRSSSELRAAALAVPRVDPATVRRVVGVDVSYADERGIAVAAVVVWDRGERAVVQSGRLRGRPAIPYRFGQLGAREAGIAEMAVRPFLRDGDLVMCDGHGLMHPERTGLGVHLAARLSRPVVAVAKNPLHPEAAKTSTERGSVREMADSEGVVGAELRTADSVRPVYVSVGGGIALDAAVGLVLDVSRYRIPEPVRLADHDARKALRAVLDEGGPGRRGVF